MQCSSKEHLNPLPQSMFCRHAGRARQTFSMEQYSPAAAMQCGSLGPEQLKSRTQVRSSHV
jgi:hypothetical protein